MNLTKTRLNRCNTDAPCSFRHCEGKLLYLYDTHSIYIRCAGHLGKTELRLELYQFHLHYEHISWHHGLAPFDLGSQERIADSAQMERAAGSRKVSEVTGHSYSYRHASFASQSDTRMRHMIEQLEQWWRSHGQSVHGRA